MLMGDGLRPSAICVIAPITLNTVDRIHGVYICAVSEPITDHDENKTIVMERGQIMRWSKTIVGTEGVTVRLCVSMGNVTFYVSSIPNPNEAVHDIQGNIDDTATIPCITYFMNSTLTHVHSRRRRSQVSETSHGTIYINVLGQGKNSSLTIQTANGNITFGKV